MAIVPRDVSDWVPEPFALNTKQCGVRAKFSGNNVVKRTTDLPQTNVFADDVFAHLDDDVHPGYDCVVYTANPLPIGQVWQTTILRTSRKWDGYGGLVSG